MVKILQTYNFAKQSTFSLNGEILAATLIDSNRVAVSSAEQFIEIYDIGDTHREDATLNKQSKQNPLELDAATAGDDERLTGKQSLATVGEVVNMIYCEAGKYLLTLEKENVSSPVHNTLTGISCTSSSNSATVYSEDDTKMFVRIYANFWKFPNMKLTDLPITIRIASMTTPKALVKSIDVIELPLRSPPDLIQCCQTSGNIIVSSKERIYLYEYTQCVHESTQPRFKYIDFLPFKFFVNLNLIPLKLYLAENVIACMNNRYCIAFRVFDVLASNVCTVGDGATANAMTYEDTYEGARTADNVVVGATIKDNENIVLASESSGVSKTSEGRSSHSHNSFESDSLDTTANNRMGNSYGGRTPIDFNLARMVNSACGRDFEVHLKSQWDNMENDCHESALNGCVSGGKTHLSTDSQEIIINPTRANEIKIKFVNEAKAMNVQRISGNNKITSAYNEDNMVQYDVRKLLQICMKSSEAGGGGRVMDILRCMDLKAIYQRQDKDTDEMDDPEYDMGNQQVPGAITTSKHINRRTLKSPKHQSCIGFALLVTSSVDGYLYLFCAKGKWYNDNEKPLAVYSFTAPVLHVHINDYVIYAVTTESVETHTSRLGHKLFNNRYEYTALAEQYPEEASPDVNDPIAVLGLSAFINVQYVCVNQNNLVLISNSSAIPHHGYHHHHHTEGDGIHNTMPMKRKNDASGGSGGGSEKRNIAARLIAEARAKHNLLRMSSSNHGSVNNEWTLYNLQVPRVERIADDLEQLAVTYRSASSTQFFDLMQEAHVMLRMSLSLQCEQLDNDREVLLCQKFVNNCRKLADFAIRSSKKEVYVQSTGFYKMCNQQLPEIYTNYIRDDELNHSSISDNHQRQTLAGLIYCVKQFLLSLGTQRLKASFLNQSVRPYFTPKPVIKQGFSQVPLALEFLNLLIKHSPADLPQIMLESPIVADVINGEIINYLKCLEKPNPDENLLFAVTACRMSNYILSQEIIHRTSRHDLAIALMRYKNVLFDDGTHLFHAHKRHKTYNILENNVLKRSPQLAIQNGKRTGNTSSCCTDERAMVSSVSHDIVSFSDFTETILLAIERNDLIEAISDAFIHAVCIEHSITLDLVLQLFLNFIASHIGLKGYQTSQKVFVNILQVYYYDYFDVNHASGPGELASQTTPHIDNPEDQYINENGHLSKTNNVEREIQSLQHLHSISDSISNSSCSGTVSHQRLILNQNNRITYDHLQEQYSPHKHNSNASMGNGNNPLVDDGNAPSEVHKKGLKILFRMYMGRLKALSDLITDLQSADVEQQSVNEDFISLRLECINFMMSHLQEMRKHQQQQPAHLYYAKSTLNERSNNDQNIVFVPYLPDYKIMDPAAFEQHLKSYIRPMPCLLERPQYLNRLPPFRRNDFTYPNTDEGDTRVHFVGWHNELLNLTLKIQSLLASSKIDREIIEEFIAFVQKTPDLIGIDSFLIIILPNHLAINYMMNFYPEYLWHYGKSNNFTPKQWESLLKKLMNKKNCLPNWKFHITEVLNNLVTDLTFEELLQSFPNEVIQSRNISLWTKELASECNTTLATYGSDFKNNEEIQNNIKSPLKRTHLPMDNVDENNVFELTLRKAVSKQRSIALRSMIESTGKQLFDATSNPMYNL